MFGGGANHPYRLFPVWFENRKLGTMKSRIFFSKFCFFAIPRFWNSQSPVRYSWNNFAKDQKIYTTKWCCKLMFVSVMSWYVLDCPVFSTIVCHVRKTVPLFLTQNGLLFVTMMNGGQLIDKNKHNACCRSSQISLIFETNSEAGFTFTWTHVEHGQQCPVFWTIKTKLQPQLPSDGFAVIPLRPA